VTNKSNATCHILNTRMGQPLGSGRVVTAGLPGSGTRPNSLPVSPLNLTKADHCMRAVLLTIAAKL